MSTKVNLRERILRESEISSGEFNRFYSEEKHNPLAFILKETNPEIARKKNVYKTIKQNLRPYKKSGYVLDKYVSGGLTLTFLGTGGGGQSVSQGARTSGFIIDLYGKRIHIDPGCGAVGDCRELTRLSKKRFDPVLTDIILVTHNHLDHAGGLEEYIEAMTFSHTLANEKIILANKTTIDGNKQFKQGPRIDVYTKNKLKRVMALCSGEEETIDEIKIKATNAVHVEAYNPKTKKTSGNCIGFRIESPDYAIGITGDTEFDKKLIKEYTGVDCLICYIVQERSRAETEIVRFDLKKLGYPKAPHIQFLGECGVEALLKHVRPRVCIITHYGDQLATLTKDNKIIFKEIPEEIAKRIEKNTGIKTIASLDGMQIKINKNIKKVVNRPYMMRKNLNY